MIKIRLRHPRGVTTLELDPNQSLHDLKLLVFSATEIPPSEQALKYGYPPRDVPDVSALIDVPIGNGEQIIVTTASPTEQPLASRSLKALNDRLSAPAPTPRTLTSDSSEAHTVGLKHDATVVALPGDTGIIKLSIVPDDNSCLFSAIGLIFEGSIKAAPQLRQVVADIIRDDPDGEYTDVFLGQPREAYIAKIRQDQTWGGAIELAAFAKHFRTEIASFDVATGRCDQFGGGNWEQRCLLVYSGIHYDAVILTPSIDSPPEFQTTVFPTSDESLLLSVSQLVNELRHEHYFTDTATFDLRCRQCGQGLKGEKSAREHATATGHVDFGEY